MLRITVGLSILLFSLQAFTDSFRCGRKLVKVGDSANILIGKCGNPVRKFSAKETINEDGRQQRASVSNWVFERRGRDDMIVSVRQGKIVRIRVD